MNRRPIPAHLVRAGGLTIALVLLAAACGDDSSNDEDTTTDTTAPATTEAPAPDDTGTTEPDEGDTGDLTPEEQVLADYEAAMDALEAAYDVPDPEHPDLLAHFSGEALTNIQAALENFRLDGLATEATIEPHAEVELDPEDENTAWVTDCYLNLAQDIDAETRDPVGEPQESVGEVKRRLELVDGTWVVTKDEYLELDACTPGDE